MNNEQMFYTDLNKKAFGGTVEDLKEMLFKYGEDKNALLAIQHGLNGESAYGNEVYSGLPQFKEEKQKVMEDFRAKQKDFAPDSAESKLAAEYNALAKKVAQLEKDNQQLQRDLAVEKAKPKSNDWPSIH